MGRLYASPLRVYLLLGALGFLGIFSGYKLPVSLFPNSSKPVIWVGIPFGSHSAEEFLQTYGVQFEKQLRAITTEKIEVDRIEATYGGHQAGFDVHFKWGVAPMAALKETQTVVSALSARLPDEMREGVQVWLNNENSGFFALSYFSEERDLDSLYDIIEPLLAPKLARVVDAQEPTLWNPSSKEIRVELKPDTMAALQLLPRDIEEAVATALGSRSGGAVTIGIKQLSIQMPRLAETPEQVGDISVPLPSGRSVHLRDVAHVTLGPKTTDSRSFRTNGSPSLILWATPKPGGNVKKMSEDMLQIVKELQPQLPKDIQYRALVDPSEFIRSAIQNVFHEVGIAALLAVLVLFLFIGSFRNVVTAAIEIPLSMVLAFILMRIAGMNLNLISLGGLALSAGMNVDASVVVMENIFRHFEMNPGKHDFSSRLRIVLEAVKEVRFAVIASTVASLVVFLPLTFTSDLSFAILGDLALAVVFSHGLSAFVALLLVPTVRLHLMNLGGDTGVPHSPIEKHIAKLENLYSGALGRFVAHPRLKWGMYGGLAAALVLLIVLVLPRLPKEILGIPDTDWVDVAVSTEGNTLRQQMESQALELERDVLREFGDKIQYTFSMIESPNRGVVMARLKNKGDMRTVWKALEARFPNTPTRRYGIGPWNPSELPIPNPPDLRIAVRGGDPRERAWAAKDLLDRLEEKKAFPRLHATPSVAPERSITLVPHSDQWAALKTRGARVQPSDLSEILRIATMGKRIGRLPVRNLTVDVVLKYPQGTVLTQADIDAFPIGIPGRADRENLEAAPSVGPRMIPLRALSEVELRPAPPAIYREDQRELILVTGRLNKGDDSIEGKNPEPGMKIARSVLAEWEKLPHPPGITAHIEDSKKELNDAISQLTQAIGLSVGLIFLVMLIQFGSFVEPILVLVSIPLGFLGVLVSLWVFGSTLSLNSVLGVILLNGIAVANSILLVDFIKRLHESGMSPRAAALEAARKRLRPILITSLTTVLGMLPIAVGAGEGGRILQPLGIAVSGGLWVSMLLTLFLVPALQVSYLEWRERHHEAGSPGWLGKFFGKPAAWLLVFGLGATAQGATVLPFNEALDRIVDRSVSVGKERANLESLEGRNLPSHLSLLPSLTVNARSKRDGLNPGFTNRREGVEGVLEMNLFRFGSDIAGMKAANREEEGQKLAIDDAILKTESDGVKNLVAFVQGSLELEIQRRFVTIRESSVQIAKARFDRGLLASQEVDKVSVDLENTLARLRDLEIEFARTKADLLVLLGEDDVEKAWPWRASLDKAPEKAFRTSDRDLTQRPDWRAAERRLEGADYRKNQGWGKIFPSLDLNLSYGTFRTETSQGLTNSPEWGAMAQLTIPLFDRLVNYGNYQSLVGQRAAAEVELERVRRVARGDWQAATEAIGHALTTARAREKTVNLARSLYEDNLKRFKQGLANANELIIDQERLYQSELLAVRGWGGAHVQFARFCHSLGRRVSGCLSRLETP